MHFRESEQSQSLSSDAFGLILNQFGLTSPKSISNLKFIMNSTKEPFEKTNESHYNRIETFCTMQIRFGASETLFYPCDSIYVTQFIRIDFDDSIKYDNKAVYISSEFQQMNCSIEMDVIANALWMEYQALVFRNRLKHAVKNAIGMTSGKIVINRDRFCSQ